jgi:type IV pilus assembly protein PilC
VAVNFSQQENSAVSKEAAEAKEIKESKSTMDKINEFLLIFSRVPSSEKLFFVQHLSVMLKAGVSLLISLQTLAKQTKNLLFVKVLNDISANVEKGKSLTESLKTHEKVFGELFVNMIEAGETSGKLENVLGQLYIQMKKQHELVSRVKGALTYPAVVLFAMSGIGIFMMIMVVPKITSMLTDFNTELPFATKILIGISNSLVSHGIVWGIGFAAFVFAVYKTLQTYQGKYYFQIFLLNMPIISTIVKKINLAKFARTVSSLLKTDIMIIKTFQITANVLGNLHYRKAVLEMAERIKKGGTINEVIAMYPKLFSPIVIQMVAIGEQTGELDNILVELAEFYENEVDQTMENLPSIIEPLLILVLGGAVGAMAVAIIMPMYSITSGGI